MWPSGEDGLSIPHSHVRAHSQPGPPGGLRRNLLFCGARTCWPTVNETVEKHPIPKLESYTSRDALGMTDASGELSLPWFTVFLLDPPASRMSLFYPSTRVPVLRGWAFALVSRVLKDLSGITVTVAFFSLVCVLKGHWLKAAASQNKHEVPWITAWRTVARLTLTMTWLKSELLFRSAIKISGLTCCYSTV